MNISILLLFLFYLLQVINCYKIATKTVSNNEAQSRITSYQSAELNQFSWQVAITVKFEKANIFCSGARISREWVLTSANCVKDAKEWDIVLGTIRRTNYSEGAFTTTGIQGIAHERFNSYLHNNIGLIKLAELPINETDAMKPIILQTKINATDNLTGTQVTVSGWGDSQSLFYQETLRYGQAEVQSNEECIQSYGEKIVVNETLCLKSCGVITAGDNGAPLVMYNKLESILVAIASFIPSHTCNVFNLNTGGFTRTGPYLDWIQEHTNISIVDDISTTSSDMSTTVAPENVE